MRKIIKKAFIFVLTFCLVFTFASCKVGETNEDIEKLTDVLIENSETMNPIIGEVPVISEEIIEEEGFDITLSFAGDMMLASYKNEHSANNFRDYSEKKEPTYFLTKVKHIFENDDFTIVNLENVFTDKELSAVKKNHSPAYWYRSATSNVDILTSSSVEAVSLENNHSNDYGRQGFLDTKETVINAGLNYGTDTEIMYLEKEGFKIAVICTGLWGSWQTDNIINRINEANEKSDFQIIFFHGGTERLHKPEEWKVAACRKLVDNGADLVIGGHPHVLQPREVYNNVEIVYSIGNFCYGGNRYPENRTVIYQYKLYIDRNLNVEKTESNIIPCYVYTGNINNYQPDIITNENEKEKVLSFMEWNLDKPF
jgi:poly-gamma-glutamate synthesis protein (capsule biosynthesis protein)